MSGDKRMKWSEKDTATLIKLYATVGIELWNTYFPSKDKHSKLSIWEKITSGLGVTGIGVQDVTRKIGHIRSRYKYELDKISRDPKYQPNTKWFKLVDSFLGPHVNQQTETQPAPKSVVNRNDDVQAQVIEKNDPMETPRKKMRTAEPPNPPKVEVNTEPESANAFDIFGKSVAAQLKIFPKQVANDTQFKIQAILTDQTLLLEEA